MILEHISWIETFISIAILQNFVRQCVESYKDTQIGYLAEHYMWTWKIMGASLRVDVLVLTLITEWTSNHKPSKVWDEITYAFPNFNG